MSQYILPSLTVPSLEKLKLMAIMEREQRLSEDYIKKCSDVSNIPNGWLKVTSDLQKMVAKKMGFISKLENELAVNYLRRAHHLYPEESVFQEAIQVKNNLANKGKYKNGDSIFNHTIFDIKMNQIKLHDTFTKNKRNLLVASSHS